MLSRLIARALLLCLAFCLPLGAGAQIRVQPPERINAPAPSFERAEPPASAGWGDAGMMLLATLAALMVCIGATQALGISPRRRVPSLLAGDSKSQAAWRQMQELSLSAHRELMKDPKARAAHRKAGTMVLGLGLSLCAILMGLDQSRQPDLVGMQAHLLWAPGGEPWEARLAPKGELLNATGERVGSWSASSERLMISFPKAEGARPAWAQSQERLIFEREVSGAGWWAVKRDYSYPTQNRAPARLIAGIELREDPQARAKTPTRRANAWVG